MLSYESKYPADVVKMAFLSKPKKKTPRNSEERRDTSLKV